MIEGLLLAAWIGCQAFDIHTTLDALKQPTAYEGNPLIRGRRLVAVKVGVNVAAFGVWRSMKQRSRRNIVAGTFAIGGCVPAVLNRRRE